MFQGEKTGSKEHSCLNADNLDDDGIEEMEVSDESFSSINATAGTTPNDEYKQRYKKLLTEQICSYVNEADINFYRTEKEKKMNENKLRIKYLLSITDEDTTLLVLTLLNLKLNMKLKFSDIVQCERVQGWEGLIEPRDVVVTFASRERRDEVYDNKNLVEELEDGMVIICDELGSERVEIWRKAVHIFGDNRVYTASGGVVIVAWNNKHYRILTLYQFKKFMKEEYSSKNYLKFLSS